MSYLSLPEAAEYLQHRTGVEINEASVLRMGTMGHLLIVAYFDGLMRNVTAHENEEIVGHLILPPRHLAAIENDGEDLIVGATSLDGQMGYSPQRVRTRAQLRVLTAELDRVAPLLNAVPEYQALSEVITLQIPEKPKSKAALQDAAILESICGAGYNPKGLPERSKGGEGVKAKVRIEMLKNVALFTAGSFKHAWDRLRAAEEIQGGE